MRRSHAQEALNRTEYAKGTDIQEHIKLLCTRRAAVDNLSTTAMSDETWRGIIIRSIPPSAKWLPVIPSLYSMSNAADIISTLLAHGMILGRGALKVSAGGSSSNTVPLLDLLRDAQIPIAKQRSDLLTQPIIATGQEVGKRVSFCPILAREQRRMLLCLPLWLPLHLPSIPLLL